MYTLLLNHSTRNNVVKIDGFQTQEEAYTFFLTYFDESYNLEIVKECEESDETCWQVGLFSLYLYSLAL